MAWRTLNCSHIVHPNNVQWMPSGGSGRIVAMTRLTGDILRTLPRARSIFAYGSAAFQQPGLYDASKTVREAPMLDIIVATDNPIAWHHEACLLSLMLDQLHDCPHPASCRVQAFP